MSLNQRLWLCGVTFVLLVLASAGPVCRLQPGEGGSAAKYRQIAKLKAQLARLEANGHAA